MDEREEPLVHSAPTEPDALNGALSPSRSGRTAGPFLVVPAGLAAAAIAYGCLLRAWLVSHLPLVGDEAVVGLMARRIDSGHFSAFYWGQSYGGVEPYVAALVLRLGGGGPTALNLTATLLSAIAASLVVAIGRAAGTSRAVAVMAGALAWVWPYVVVWNSVRELGFRYATLCCGLVALLCAVRLQRRGGGRLAAGTLGVALGVGWWASPEIAYFAVPCLLLLGGWWRDVGASTRHAGEMRGRSPGRRTALALMVGGALIGSLPWWYANVGSGFASLRRSAFPAGGGLGYGARLSVFFRDMLPLQLGVRTVFGGAWVGGAHLGHVLFVLVLAVVAAGIVRAVWVRRGDTRCLAPVALAGGIVVFPFLYAAVPASGYWVDGRYGLYLPFLVVPLLALALPGQARPASLPPAEPVEEHASRRGLHAARRPQVPSVTSIGALIGAGLGVLGATLLSVGAAHAGGVPASPRFFTSWGDPNAQTRQVVHEMLTHHVADAYGNYWTAYDLEFIGQGSVTVSPSVLDVDRWPALAAKVAASPDPAWLFIAPGKTAAADAAFLNTQPGPGSYTERSFEARLTELGVTYRVVHLGVLDAVVPSRRVLVP